MVEPTDRRLLRCTSMPKSTWPTTALLLTTAATLALPSTAGAQPGDGPPVPPRGAPRTNAPRTPAGATRSETTATNLAIAGSVLPFALLLAAGETYGDRTSAPLLLSGLASLVLTPSAGHWYAGKFYTAGMGRRLGGLVATSIGGGLLLRCTVGGGRACDGAGAGVLTLLSTGGLVALVTGFARDIATADDAVRAHNTRAQVSVTVTAQPFGNGSAPVPGLAVAGAF